MFVNSSATNTAIVRQGAANPHLKMLHISGNQKVVSGAIVKLASKCTKLVHVEIRNCPNITDSAVRALARQCRDMVYIDLTNCKCVTNRSIVELTSNCFDIAHVILGGTSVTDEGLKILARSYPNLLSIDVSRCVRITNESARALGQHCNFLRSASFAATRIDNIGVIELASCRKLEVLKLNDCAKVTDIAMPALTDFCPQLKSLNVKNTGVTKVGIMILKTNCNELDEVVMSAADA